MTLLARPQDRIRTVLLVLCLFLLGAVFPAAARGAEISLESPSYILMEPNTGEVLLESNSHQRMAPASVTKLMTLVLAAEALEAGKAKLTDRVTASENAAKMGGAQIYLELGEEMTLNDMLLAIAVGSANDACVAVAEHLYGSQEEFVRLMNQRAEELGMKDTHYVNCHGLPAAEHYTSAYDQAILARHALRLPKVLELTSIKEHPLREGKFQLYNHNKLLWWYPGADGLKTGWSSEARYCLAATAEREGLRLVAVTLGAPQPRGNFRDCMKLFNYGFARYSYRQLVDQMQLVNEVAVSKGKAGKVAAVAAEKGGVLLPKGKEGEYRTLVELPSRIDAPVSRGQKLGELVIYQQDREAQRIELIAAEDVERSGFLLLVGRFLWNLIRLD